MPNGPLEGLSVLDLTQGLAGPFCTKRLSDFGAEVIKVEPPHTGDWARQRPPFFQDRPGLEHSLVFAYLNTNKRSLTLNLDSVFGQQAVRELAKSVDIMVEGYPGGYLEERGLDHERLRADNPRLVFTSLPLFDRRGPYASYKATELNLYAMSGLMSLAGGEGDPPNRAKPGGYQAQYMAGLQASAYTLFAAFQAQTTGEGSWIDTSVEETCAKVVEHSSHLTIDGSGRTVRPEGGPSEGASACREGHVMVTLYYFQLQAIADLLGKPLDDENLSAADAEAGPLRTLKAEVIEWLKDKTADEAQAEGQSRHLAITKVNTTRDLVESPHYQARGFFTEVDHHAMGLAEYPGPPFRLTESPAVPPQAAPRLGEANELILCDRLGHSLEDLAQLREAGTI